MLRANAASFRWSASVLTAGIGLYTMPGTSDAASFHSRLPVHARIFLTELSASENTYYSFDDFFMCASRA